MTNLFIPALIQGPSLEDYFLDHVKPGTPVRWSATKNGFFRVTKPLHVFKKASSANGNSDRIVNMIVPVGAEVYAGPNAFLDNTSSDSRKMRASKAFVHSVFQYKTRDGNANSLDGDDDLDDFSWTFSGAGDSIPTLFDEGKLRERKNAYSGWDNEFRYRVGRNVKPQGDPFSHEFDQCEAGIHFFLNVRDALKY